ncbi:MAG: hypothetical protein RLZZ142_2461, partial [Verrucomicrobiota bacterium]
MLGVILNGQERLVREGVSILEAARSAGVEIPSLCFHRGLKPSGACRLCVVEVEGWESYAAACTTEVAQGMRVQTHSEGVEAMRQTVLELLARAYPGAARERLREKPFQRLLRRYGIPLRAGGEEPLPCGSAGGNVAFRDDTHPYVRADLTSCIGCFGCVRACEEIQGQFVWRVWKRGQQTRVEPVRETLLASGCVGCGACVDACPTGALEDVGGLEPDGAAEWTRTVCPYCGVGCELEVGTRRGRIVQIQPAGDAPVNRGHLCVKGRYAFGFVHAPDRVTRPMVREAGRWKEVTWEDALGLVASRLKVAIGTLEGRCRVGVLASARATNEENYLIQKFARVVLGTNNVDCCARVCHAPTAAAMREMLGTGAATNAFEDIEEAEAFLLVGCNPTENHPVVGARIKQRVLQGAALVVLDPREIELARYGGVHLPVRPGCNLPVLHAMAHVIVAEGLFDERAIAERVAEWDAYRAFVAEWTPERAAALSGVSAGGIREAARIYARAKPAMIFHGLGVTEHGQGTGGVMAVVNLALLTGNFGIRGSGIHPLRGQNNVQGAAHMGCDPGHLPGGLSLEEGR